VEVRKREAAVEKFPESKEATAGEVIVKPDILS